MMKILALFIAIIATNSANAQYASQEELEQEMKILGYTDDTVVWTTSLTKLHGYGKLPGFTKLNLKKIFLRLDDITLLKHNLRKQSIDDMKSKGIPTGILIGPEEPPASSMEVHALALDEKGNEVQLILVKFNNGSISYLNDKIKTTLSKDDPHKKYKKWGRRVFDAISKKSIFIGMTSEQVSASWGNPNNINRMVGSWGRYEQWVYGDASFGTTYLYIKNGRVSSYQDY